jgi:TolB protein
MRRLVIVSALCVLTVAACEKTPPLSPLTLPYGTVAITVTSDGGAPPWHLIGPAEIDTSGSGTMWLHDMPVGNYQITWLYLPGCLQPTDNEEARALANGDTIEFSQHYDRIRQVTNDGENRNPTFNKDASAPRLAFLSDRDGLFDIWIATDDIAQPIKVTSNPRGEIRGFDWSRTNQQFIFDSDRDDNCCNLYVVNVSTGTEAQLYFLCSLGYTPGCFYYPRWSAVSDEIIFLWWPCFSSCDYNAGDVIKAPSAGDYCERILSLPDGVHHLAWSRDTTSMAYIYDDEGLLTYDQVAMTHLGTTTVSWVTLSPGNKSYPCWSPDGTHICYTSDETGNRDLWIINVDGDGIVQLTTDEADDWSPSWSADGRAIAFISERDGSRDIYLVGVPEL